MAASVVVAEPLPELALIEQDNGPLTIEDLHAMPDDGKRYELILGEIVVSASPSTRHQRALAALYQAILLFNLEHKLGELFLPPFDVRLSPHDVLIPDFLFVTWERRDALLSAQRIDGGPSLAVEAFSPSTRRRDVITKTALYAQYGVDEYWLVDPDLKTVQVRVLRDGILTPVAVEGGLARSSVLPGFAVDIASLFVEVTPPEQTADAVADENAP